jgi:hypothetical protein
MYLWNISKLAKDLANGKVTEKSGMHYFLASTLLILFQTYYALWWGVERSWLFYFELVVLSVIAIYGCVEAFKVNGGNAGSNFVLKAICLSVPAGVRVGIFSIIFGELLNSNAQSIFSLSTFANPLQAFTIVSYAGFIGFSILYWWLLYNGFNQIRTIENANP